MFRNNGDLTFTEISSICGLDHTRQGRSLVNLDYDNDGDQDIVIFNKGERISLFRNDLSGPGAHWLRVFLDTSARADLAPNGLGARVIVSVVGAAGAIEQLRYIHAGGSYLATSEPSAHFGLGSATFVSELRVEWPNSELTVLRDLATDQVITVEPARQMP